MVGATRTYLATPYAENCRDPNRIHTLAIKYILLCSILLIDTIELKAEVFALILRIRYSHNCWWSCQIAIGADSRDNGIFIEF